METTIAAFIEELKADAQVEGILIFGSYARGDNRSNSDVDVFVLVKEGEWRDVHQRDSVNFEMVYSSEEAAMGFAQKRPDSYLNLWKDARIMFDKNGRLHEMSREAAILRKKGKATLTEKQLKHEEFDFEDSIRVIEALADKDMANAEMYLQSTVLELLQFYFRKNAIWSPPPKKQLDYLRKNEPELSKLFDNFYSTGIMAQRIETAKAIGQHLFS